MRLTTLVAGAGVLWLALVCGNAFAAAPDALPEPRPLGRDLPTFQPSAEPPEAPTPTDGLTLRQALALALLRNPQLAAFSWQVRAREAETLQAGLLPNPELGIEMENFAGSGSFSGAGAAETTVTLSQLVELGGKRARRRSAASLEGRLAGWDFEAKRLDVVTDTAKAFIHVLAAQERLSQAEELTGLAERFFGTVSERVEAGKVSPVEQTRAQVPLSEARIARDRARIALNASRKELTALWGEDAAAFERAVGSLEEIAPVPAEARLAALLEPESRRRPLEDRGPAAQRPPGPGARQRHPRRDPVRRRAQPPGDGRQHLRRRPLHSPARFRPQPGGIAAARAARSQTRQEGRAARNRTRAALAAAYRELSASFGEVQTMKQKILPAATASFEATDLGYREGKFGFLAVLDAQRTLFDVKGRYLEALTAYHQARAEVERLIGAPLPNPSKNATAIEKKVEVKR